MCTAGAIGPRPYAITLRVSPETMILTFSNNVPQAAAAQVEIEPARCDIFVIILFAGRDDDRFFSRFATELAPIAVSKPLFNFPLVHANTSLSRALLHECRIHIAVLSSREISFHSRLQKRCAF